MNENINRKAVSVVIVTFNSEDLIMGCLDSIFKYNDISEDLEVVLVDNCSVNYLSMFSCVEKNMVIKLYL